MAITLPFATFCRHTSSHRSNAWCRYTLASNGETHCSLWRPYLRLRPFAVLAYSRFQPFLDQAMNSLVGDSVLDETHRPFVTHVVEKATYVRIHDPVHSLPLDSHDQRIHRVVRTPPRPQSVTETPEILLIDCVEDRHHRLLYDFIFQRRDADRPLPTVRFLPVNPP